MTHVAGIVGGFNSQEKVVGQEGRIFNLIPKEKQREAVKYLTENAFTHARLDDRRRDSAAHRAGGRDRPHSHRADPRADSTAQQRALRPAARTGNTGRQSGLLAGGIPRQRAQRHLEGTRCARGEGGPLSPRIAAILSQGDRHQDESRWNAPPHLCPPAFPKASSSRASSPAATKSPCIAPNSAALAASITAAMAKTTDHETKAHLEASRDEIAKILDPKFAPATPAAAAGFGGRGGAR